jgi:trehalose 6-phosphate synthase/phosphatase
MGETRRLIIVSNRLPITAKKHGGKIEFSLSSGGLATGLSSLDSHYDKHWMGWPGLYLESDQAQEEMQKELSAKNIHPVFITPEDIENYYEGFSNKTIWPLFHYFNEFTRYTKEFWEAYKKVNVLFFEELKQIIHPDDIVWVHDYHLMLLPGLLRQQFPNNRIGFFLHIPFPSYELFRTLPYRNEIMEGILGADLIGFHTFEYMRHFLIAVYRIKDLESRLGRFYYDDHLVQVDAFPMGIDYMKFHKAIQNKLVQQKVKSFKENFGSKKLILSVDRLDYSKGILQRLKAFDRLLEQYPEHLGTISLIVVVVPSRSQVEQYNALKIEIDETIGALNGKYASIEWTPVHYYYRNLPFRELVALYNLSDIALITPFRDGMNLIAKEYIASKADGKGVLILSEMAGSAQVLKEALIINPNDIDEIVKSLQMAINMLPKEQKQRIDIMQKSLEEHTVQKWAHHFIQVLEKIYQEQKKLLDKILDEDKVAGIQEQFIKSHSRLFMINYDGTLVKYSEDPAKAIPSKEILKMIKDLSENSRLLIISGRDHITLDKWFSGLNIDLIAEYGTWLREEGVWTQAQMLEDAWKNEIHPIINHFMNKTPGSFIEEKSYSLAWHYRKADPFLSDMRLQELINCLIYPCTKHKLEIFYGSKVLEIKPVGVDKKTVTRNWLNKQSWDFIMAIGDEKTDEDIFEVLPEEAFSIRVGRTPTRAKFSLKNPSEVLSFLVGLTRHSEISRKKRFFSITD